MAPSVRLFAALMALPGLVVGVMCILDLVDHPSWRVFEWAAASTALGLFFAVTAVIGREP